MSSQDEEISEETIEEDLEDAETLSEDDGSIVTYLSKSWKETTSHWKQNWNSLIYHLKHPRIAFKELIQSKIFITNILAVVVGVIGAVAALGFEWLYEGSNLLFMEKLFPIMTSNFGSWRFLAIIISPLIAAIFTAPIIWRFNPESKGSGIPNVMESIALHDGHIQKRTPFIKMFTAAICSGSGMSLGREGPITQIGAGFSSNVAHLVGLHGRKMRIVVISGLSAAIAATFNSPIGGALFGIEILLVSLVADEIVPVVIASLTSSTLSAIFDITRISPNSTGLPEPSFNIEALRDLGWDSFIFDIHWFLILGILAGLVGVFYSKFFHLIREIFNRIKLTPVFIPIIGALLTGIISIGSPKDVKGIPLIFGASYSTLSNILNNNTSTLESQNPFNSLFAMLILLMFLKILITSFSVGSGNPGGIFAPALFVGACTGSLYGLVLNSNSKIDVNTSVLALAGLAAVFAGSTRAPLTMIFMGAEMTGNIKLMVPLMLTCSLSYLVCRGFLKESIYTQPLADKGLNIKLGGYMTILSQTKVEEVMEKEVEFVYEDTKIDVAAIKAQEKNIFGFPIVDSKKRLIGMISLSDIRAAKLEEKLDSTVMEFVMPNYIILTADQSIEEALDQLNRFAYKRAPVVNSLVELKLIGILSKSDILRLFEMDKIGSKFSKD